MGPAFRTHWSRLSTSRTTPSARPRATRVVFTPSRICRSARTESRRSRKGIRKPLFLDKTSPPMRDWLSICNSRRVRFQKPSRLWPRAARQWTLLQAKSRAWSISSRSRTSRSMVATIFNCYRSCPASHCWTTISSSWRRVSQRAISRSTAIAVRPTTSRSTAASTCNRAAMRVRLTTSASITFRKSKFRLQTSRLSTVATQARKWASSRAAVGISFTAARSSSFETTCSMRVRSSLQLDQHCASTTSATASVVQSSKTNCSSSAVRSGNTFVAYRMHNGARCRHWLNSMATFHSACVVLTGSLELPTTACSAIRTMRRTRVLLRSSMLKAL